LDSRREPWVEHSQELPTPATTATNTAWRKSTASGSNSSDCLEVALMPDLVLVRDSKDAEGPRLRFVPSAWTGFMDTLGRDAS